MRILMGGADSPYIADSGKDMAASWTGAWIPCHVNENSFDKLTIEIPMTFGNAPAGTFKVQGTNAVKPVATDGTDMSIPAITLPTTPANQNPVFDIDKPGVRNVRVVWTPTSGGVGDKASTRCVGSASV